MERKISRNQTTLWLALSMMGVALTITNSEADDIVGPDDMRQKNQWVQEHLLDAKPKLPFSFVYGKQASNALLTAWPKKTETKQLDGARTQRTFVWTDPKSGLEVRLAVVDYAEFPVVEWTAYFRNGGKTDTSILENIQPLDTTVPLTDNGLPMVLYSKGCGGMDTYSLQKRPLNQLDSFSISNEGGGKTVETIPFFNILMDQHGYDRRRRMAREMVNLFHPSNG